MRKLFFTAMTLSLLAPQLWAAANCVHSSSWQCQQHISGSSQGSQTGGGISTAGHSPNPSAVNQHLGSAGGGNQPPVKIKAPVPTPMQVPDQVPHPVPTPTPMAIPPRVPQPVNVPDQVPHQVPTPTPVAVPPRVPKPVNVPSQVPQQVPAPTPVAVPQRVPQLVIAPHPTHVHVPSGPTATQTGLTGPAGQTASLSGPKPVQVPHTPHNKPVKPQVVSIPDKTTPMVPGSREPTGGATHHIVPAVIDGGQMALAGALRVGEVVEPGIQNRSVELYRSEDAEELLYRDVIPMDKTGFHLTVIGIRPPSYH